MEALFSPVVIQLRILSGSYAYLFTILAPDRNPFKKSIELTLEYIAGIF